MSRGEANKVYNNFVGGLNTESSPLTFPDNASLDEENMVLSRDGSRQRRLGMEYEDNFVKINTGQREAEFDGLAVSSFAWGDVNDDPTVALSIVQIGNELYFFDLLKDSQTPNQKNGGVALRLNASASQVYSFTPIVGRLIVATGETSITVLEYDAANDTVIATERELYIRDFFGVEDNLGIGQRPTLLSETHKYNLHNQGWSDVNLNTFKTSQTVFPSNADIMHLGKDSDENFDSALLVKQFFGTTPAAKGKNIINAFNRGTSRNSGGTSVAWRTPFTDELPFNIQFPDAYKSIDFTGTLNEDRTVGGHVAVATYAGRVFYAGAGSELINGDSKSPNMSSYIFFSQVMENIEKATACYSVADPTSEHISDLVQSDGGTIKINGASNILRLISLGNALVVLAETGVWAIFGSASGFSATNFQVKKISDIGATSGASAIAANESVFYWAKTGIQIISGDDATGQLTSTNIVETTIQTLYNEIPEVVKQNVPGIYDPAANQVRWLYTINSDYTGVTNRFKFDRELIFDLTLNAFFKHFIKSSCD